MKTKTFTILTFIFCFISIIAQAQSGAIDPDFGQVNTGILSYGYHDLEELPDGKILISDSGYRIRRLTQIGSLDSTMNQIAGTSASFISMA